MKSTLTLSLIAALSLAATGLKAQADSRTADAEPTSRAAAKDVSDLLRDIPKARGVPGLVAAFVDRNGAVAIGAAGVRRRGDAAPVLKDDPFHLGSCTKAMTATLCAVCVDAGELRYETKLSAVFPDLLSNADSKWGDVALLHLLTNTSGVPSDLTKRGLWGDLWNFKGTPVEARRALLLGVLKDPPLTPPGETYLYSNGGFAIAGHMVETALRKPFEDVLRERLFVPLGMTRAGFGPPGTFEKLDAPRGHAANGSPVEPSSAADNPPAITPAGRVHAPIEDWAKFVAWHLRGAAGDAAPLQPGAFAKLHEKGPAEGSDYACGWVKTERPWAGGDVLMHSGSNTMWFCVAWLAPKRGFAAIAAVNQGGDAGAKAADDAVSALLGASKELLRDAPSRR
jgi:CubicO group peptidase (beta-lactamase class C family)